MTKNVLCIVATGPQLRELFPVAKALKEGIAETDVTFLFEKEYETAGEHRRELGSAGFVSLSSNGSRHANPVEPVLSRSGATNWRQKIRQGLSVLPEGLSNVLIQLLRYLLYTQLLSFPYWYFRYRRHYQSCCKLIKSLSPDMVLLSVDAAHYDSGAWIKASAEAGLPSALIPFAMADRENLAEDRLPLFSHQGYLPENMLLKAIYPKWGCSFHGRSLVALPAAQALAKQLLGVVMSDPWVYNGSGASLILLESEYALDQLVNQQADPSRMVVTGRIAHDEISKSLSSCNELRERVADRYGMDPKKPIVAAALTPDKFDAFGHQTEFSSYREMVEFWVDLLSGGGERQVLVSVHPSDSPDQVQYIERGMVRICGETLSTIIPISDLYVTDCSATTRLASACGVPVLDYDLYHFNLSFNRVGGGSVHVDSKEQFVIEWERIWQHEKRLDELRVLQRENAAHFALLDGHAEKRIVDCIKKLIRS